MFGKRSDKAVIAAVTIESGGAGVALIAQGKEPHLLSYAREDLQLESRSKNSLCAGVIQALGNAVDKALAAVAKDGAVRVSGVYCVVGAPWTRSFADSAHAEFERPSTISDAMISSMAKQALKEQKNIETGNLLEANVSRVLLNGYPTSTPAGKHAQIIDIRMLMSDCDPALKDGATELLARSFPDVQPVWRSSARATLAAAKTTMTVDTCLVVEVGQETSDLISVRKGVLDQRILTEQGVRQILTTLAKGKPVEETISLMELVEREQGDADVAADLRQSIAKAEPELVHVFGEALAKLSAPRKLSDTLILIAPPALLPWLSRFFARIDFTQFTSTTRPFVVHAFTPARLAGVPQNDPSIFSDPAACIACDLVNSELSS